LLYAAAFNTEWPAFRKQIRAISLLAVGLVLFMTALVAAAAHYAIGLPWASGFVLGAIVSPPDAVAATAITRRLRVPKIVSTILEGESLVNDATALVTYRLAVAAVMGAGFSLGHFAVQFVVVSIGGVLVGLAGGWAVFRLHGWLTVTRLGDPKLQITITLLTPFAVYLPAEHLGVSGVLAVVACGLWIGARWESVFNPELYLEGRAVWEMVEFLLNGLVFILIGLQLPAVLDALQDGHTMGELVGGAAAVSGVVIIGRLVWMFPGAYVPRWLDRKLFGCTDPYPSWKLVTVVGWTGMRGVVSLAAALAIPGGRPGDAEFPGRDMILFLTFWVIFATLVVQGLTL
ncbi:MAG: cation:proton antiporter, partial [Fimbriiglobus sp.]